MTLNPPFIHPDQMPDRFAVYGYGACMEPEIADGALLVIDKRETVSVGDTVNIVFTEEAYQRRGLPSLVKRLAVGLPPEELPRSMGALVVEQLNPPRLLSIPMIDVAGVFKCVGTAISNGDGTAKEARS